MSRLTDLLRQLRSADAQLGADLEKEIAALTKRRSFGLVFERHQPEAVELPGQPVRRTSKVRVLPPRGDTVKGDQRLWRVESLDVEDRAQVARLLEANSDAPESATAAVDDLVVVAEFEDKIYPGLVETGRVENGGDKPFHTVINAENFHALEMLTYTHRGKIDAIYIDPPYNTGARDWKYNNDYVEGDDDYRHSKWLAFMERRLLLARELLNPDDAVLIVTIDEKEYLRLGMLLEQTFPAARIQMVAAQIAPQGNPRNQQFYRTDEYVFFVGFGAASPAPLALGDSWRSGTGDAPTKNINWASLLRTGSERRRQDRPSMFYPIFVENTDRGARIRSFGAPFYGDDFTEVEAPAGTAAVWPIGRDGEIRRWQVSVESAERLRADGFLKAGRWNAGRTAIQYLARSNQQGILNGSIETSGRSWDGSYLVSDDHTPTFVPGTLWKVPSHDATRYGTQLIPKLLPSRKFPFPKSLYAVEDALRFYLKNREDAVVLDFFAGSGTTAHAVMRLNHADQGRRQCISITNNEVSADEQEKLRKQGLRPGDLDWERLGICDYITKPRIRAAITGKTPDGSPIKDDYKFTDEFPMADGFEENAAFFTLTYESPLSVRHNRAFEHIAPMLWLRAGSAGRIIDDLGDRGWDISKVYAVLENIDAADDFFRAMQGAPEVRTVFVVTDDDAAFQMVCREVTSDLHVVQLYESYLQNFEINQGRGF